MCTILISAPKPSSDRCVQTESQRSKVSLYGICFYVVLSSGVGLVGFQQSLNAQDNNKIAQAVIVRPQLTQVSLQPHLEADVDIPMPAADNQSDQLPKIKPRRIDAETYRSVYESIPFSRTEYDANPSYRHETAMEIMFGQMRSTVIHRHQTLSPTSVSNAPWWADQGSGWQNYGSSRIRLGVFYAPRFPGYLRRWY